VPIAREEPGFLGKDADATLHSTGHTGILLDSVLTGKFRKALAKYTRLNNVVIAGPTGVGKTLAAELALISMLQGSDSFGLDPKSPVRPMDETGLDIASGPVPLPAEWQGSSTDTIRSGKMVYLAPSKALCEERASDWALRFSKSLDLVVESLPGDFYRDEHAEAGSAKTSVNARLARADVVCTTPEKWDSITRRWQSNAELIGEVSLVVIDEVHTLSDDRGATLEAVVARMRTIANSEQVRSKGWPCSRLRIVALSATLPNVADVALWLRAPRAATFQFPSSARPVPLDVHVRGYNSRGNNFLFVKLLLERVYDVIISMSSGRPSLVFCTSRKQTQQLAQTLS